MDDVLLQLIVALSLTALTVFLLGAFVYFNKKDSPTSKIFFFYCFFISWWSFFQVLLSVSQHQKEALTWGRIMMAGDWFIPSLFVHFVIRLLEYKPSKWLLPTIYSTSVVLSGLSLTSYLVEDAVPKLFLRHFITPGILFPYGVLFFIFCVTWGLYRLGKAWIYTSGPRRDQYGILFWSSLFGYVGGCGNFLLVFNISIPLLIPYGTYAVPIYVAATGYAIVRYRFLDISTVIHKTAMWAAMSSLVVVPVAGLFYVVHRWIQDLSPVQLSFAVGAVALLLIPYVKVIQPWIDHLFQRRKHDLQKILQDFIHEIAVLKGLDELVNKLQTTISSVLYPETSSIILFDVKSDVLKPFRVSGLPGTFSTEHHGGFLKWLERINTLVELDLVDVDPRFAEIKGPAKQYFNVVRGRLVLPLTHDGKLQGVINLGQKQNLKPYTALELDFLSNLKVEASIAFSNSLLYDDVSKMSLELKQWATELEHKVDERTKELAESKQEVVKAYQKLKELDHLKSQFFANISHELRTPLTLILAPLESMLKGGQPGMNGEHRNVQIMHSNALRLLKLINSLLDLAKIDAGKMALYYAKGDLKTFIKGIVTSVGPMADKKQIRLSYRDQGELPELYFDRDKIEKVMLNLLFNSLKFTETGGKVEVSCSKDNGHVLVKVTDTGIGIAKENHTKIFERFSQVDASVSKKYEGTGVGLALAKELVELHQGRIWVESEIGRGTTMAFTLPMITQQDHLPADRRVQQQEVAEKKRVEDWTQSIHTEAEYSGAGIVREASEDYLPESSSTNGHRLLLVEDNPDMLNFLIFQLKEEYALITARDGADGIQKAMTHLPDLVVSDVMMPVKDGYQLCKEIKADPRTRHIPVILLTAKADLSMKIEGLQYGADDYLTKPFSSEELLARIKSLLHLRQLEREIQSRNEELQHALTELKETQAQLVHSEKMAALGLLVAGVAHEINNPVSFAKSSLSNLRRSFGEAKKLLEESQSSQAVLEKSRVMESAIEIIKTGLERTEVIVNDLKNFVRKDQLHLRPTDLHHGLDSTLTLLGHELGDTIKIEKAYGNLEPVDTIPGQINQVFMNLLHNAIEAIRMRGTGEGVIRIKTWKMGDEAFVSIWDNGTGIRKEAQAHVFEPFFTTKEVGKGTGLGLAVTYRIIENHKGRIEVKSEPGKWTEFTVVLPFRQDQKA